MAETGRGRVRAEVSPREPSAGEEEADDDEEEADDGDAPDRVAAHHELGGGVVQVLDLLLERRRVRLELV